MVEKQGGVSKSQPELAIDERVFESARLASISKSGVLGDESGDSMEGRALGIMDVEMSRMDARIDGVIEKLEGILHVRLSGSRIAEAAPGVALGVPPLSQGA